MKPCRALRLPFVAHRGYLFLGDERLAFKQVLEKREAGLLLAVRLASLNAAKISLYGVREAVLLQQAHESLGRGLLGLSGGLEAGRGRLHALEGTPSRGRQGDRANEPQLLRMRYTALARAHFAA